MAPIDWYVFKSNGGAVYRVPRLRWLSSVGMTAGDDQSLVVKALFAGLEALIPERMTPAVCAGNLKRGESDSERLIDCIRFIRDESRMEFGSHVMSYSPDPRDA